MYINIDTRQYPMTEADVKASMPNTSFPISGFTAPDGFAVVSTAEKPAFDPMAESVVEGAPIYTGGQWVQTWTVVALDGAAIAKKIGAYQRSIVDGIQEYLDAECRAHNYDGILSLCSYATSASPKFGPEGRAGVLWRDAVWMTSFNIENAVQAGARAMPSLADVLSELPEMSWPN